MLDTLQTGLVDTATRIGSFVETVGRDLGGAEWNVDVSSIMSSNNRALGDFLGALRDLLFIFKDIAVVAGPTLVEPFARWVRTLTAGWRASIAFNRESGAMAAFFQRAGARAAQLARITGNLASALFGLGKAAIGASGNDLMKSFEDTTQAWADFVNSDDGREKMRAFFESVTPVTREIGKLVGNIGEFLAKAGGTDGGAVLAFFQTLNFLVQGLSNLMSAGGGAGGSIVGGFMAIAGAAGAISFVSGIFLSLVGNIRKVILIGRGLVGGFVAVGRVVLNVLRWLRPLVTVLSWVGRAALLLTGPIGLTVLAIAALAAGLVLAYKKSETFRAIVDGAFNAVKGLLLDVLTFMVSDFLPFWTKTMPAAFRRTMNWFKRQWRKIAGFLSDPVGKGQKGAQKAVDAIQDGLGDLWGWVRGKWRKGWANFRDWVVDPVERGRKAVGKWLDRIRTHLGNIWSYARDKWRKGWAKIKDWATDPIADARKNIMTWLDRIRKNIAGIHQWARDTWRNNWKNITKWFAKPMQDVRDIFGRLLGRGGSIRSIFNDGVKAIGTIWAGIRAAAAKPVNFVIDWVYNKGIRNVIGAIPNVKKPPPVKRLRGYAQGGVLPGYTPGRDVHHFVSATAGRLALSGGEGIMRPEFVKAVGGAPGIERLNAAAKRGAARLKGRTRHPNRKFAGGGVWHPGTRSPDKADVFDRAWDINSPGGTGTPVRAFLAGAVARAVSLGDRSFGNYIVLNHPAADLSTLYAHLSRMNVSAGQKVARGQVIGAEGSVGNSSGPHLHFEIGGSGNYSMGGGGGGGGGGGVGKWIVDIVKHLNPLRFLKVDDWVGKLKDKGEWGGMMGDAVKGVMPAFKGWAKDKIEAAFKGAQGILSGGKYFTTKNRHFQSFGASPSGKPSSEMYGGGGSKGGLTANMARAFDHIRAKFGNYTIYGYSNRNIGGTNTKSDHAYGKALDIMGAKQNIADYFATGPGHRMFGIENTIYNRRIHNQRGWHAYNGSSPHTDHVHIDQYDRGGQLYPGSTLSINNTGKTETVFTNDNMVTLGRDLQKAASTLRALVDPAKPGGVGAPALVENLHITGRPNDVPDMLRDATHQLRVIRQGGVYAKSAT
jgi:hypothetical protein